MTLVNIISALGNNNSIYPLLIRDCGIENTAKCTMTYLQNAKKSKLIAKEATRERIIEEYGTSAIWLGGIPLLNKICDKYLNFKKIDPNIDIRLFKGSENQNLKLNIEKFKNLATNETKTLINANKNKYISAQIQKFILTTTIPIAIMGFILPKLNFAYTNKKLNKNQNANTINAPKMNDYISSVKNKTISFTGIEKLAQVSDLQKMMILDGGLTIGRVKNARNKAEKIETIFKMAGMCYLNYIAPKKIENILNKLTKKIFKLNTNLDVKLLGSKEFINSIQNNSLKLPTRLDEKGILDFIDNNPKSIFVNECKKLDLVSFINDEVRDPRKFVETEKIANFQKDMQNFISNAIKSDSIEKFAKKSIYAKSFNTILNIGLSSFLLAIILPKAQFMLRKLITGTELDPGIQEALK